MAKKVFEALGQEKLRFMLSTFHQTLIRNTVTNYLVTSVSLCSFAKG